jgi:CCAAT-binding transcription factor (CBF-B/NF-YA) subunit B
MDISSSWEFYSSNNQSEHLQPVTMQSSSFYSHSQTTRDWIKLEQTVQPSLQQHRQYLDGQLSTALHTPFAQASYPQFHGWHPIIHPPLALAVHGPFVPGRSCAEHKISTTAGMSLGQSRPEMNNVNDQRVALVNHKQYHRILIRRRFRANLSQHTRKPYMHESRSNFARKRPRAPGGRFLSANEIAAMKDRAEKLPSRDVGTGMPTSGIGGERNINFVDLGDQCQNKRQRSK